MAAQHSIASPARTHARTQSHCTQKATTHRAIQWGVVPCDGPDGAVWCIDDALCDLAQLTLQIGQLLGACWTRGDVFCERDCHSGCNTSLGLVPAEVVHARHVAAGAAEKGGGGGPDDMTTQSRGSVRVGQEHTVCECEGSWRGGGGGGAAEGLSRNPSKWCLLSPQPTYPTLPSPEVRHTPNPNNFL
jgi:hypothetical protein